MGLWLLKVGIARRVATEVKACCCGCATIIKLGCVASALRSEVHDADGSRHRMKSKRNLYATRYILHIKSGGRRTREESPLRSQQDRHNPMPLPANAEPKNVLYTIFACHAFLEILTFFLFVSVHVSSLPSYFTSNTSLACS